MNNIFEQINRINEIIFSDDVTKKTISEFTFQKKPLNEQNLSSAFKRIQNYLTKDVENIIDRYVEKRGFFGFKIESLEARIENFIRKNMSSDSGKQVIRNMIKDISESNQLFAKNFVEDNLNSFRKLEKNFDGDRKKTLSVIEKNYGKNVRTYYEKLNPEPQIKLTDVLSPRVESTIKNKEVKKQLENFIKSTFTEGNYDFKIVDGKQKIYFVSAKGERIDVKSLDTYIKGHISGHETELNQTLESLPRNLADGTEFRNKIFKILEKEIPEDHLKDIPPMDLYSKWRVDTNPNESIKNLEERQNKLLNDLVNKCEKFNSVEFDPTKIQIIGKQYISGRNVLEIKLPDGDKILMYESGGFNTATTGKENGEWFVIPGFGKTYSNDGRLTKTWFIKRMANINITKNIPYFKKLDYFLRNFHGYN